MSALNQYAQEFLRGLRSVPEYLEIVCRSCNGGCRTQVDDQCLFGAWYGYIEAAFEQRLDAFEVGRRCASAQVAQTESHPPQMEPAGPPGLAPLPCRRSEA